MAPTHLAARTARLALSANGQRTVVCRSCLSRQQFSTTPQRDVDPKTFFGGLSSKIFGTAESKKTVERREAAQERQIKKQSQEPKSIIAADKKIYQVAPRVSATTYEAAKTWDGLPKVGSDAWAKQQGLQKTIYTGFKRRSKRDLTRVQFENIIYHITADVLALHQQGRDVSHVCFGYDGIYSHPEGVQLLEKDGKLALESSAETAISDVAAGIRSEYQEEPAQSEDELISELRKSHKWKPSQFIQAAFPSPEVKLAILKRTMQLTGYSIPDRSMTQAGTLSSLIDALYRKDPPAKLAQNPTLQTLPTLLPNVTVYPQKRLRAHEEATLGRAKLIDNALGLQGLLDDRQAFKDASRARREAAEERKMKRREDLKNATPEEREKILRERESGLELVGERPGEARPGVARLSTREAPKMAKLRDEVEGLERAKAEMEVRKRERRRFEREAKAVYRAEREARGLPARKKPKAVKKVVEKVVEKIEE